ncbi:MAG: response regulator [Hydrogenophaga sp.]|jgi:two-component system response regulator QseB
MRLLILEDDLALGDALAVGLRQHGHVVDWFSQGTQAHSALMGTDYDAVVLDLGLPGEDGVVWLQRWRGEGNNTPVLVLTARDGLDDRIEGLDSGADDYLIKPIAIDELAARLRAMLRRSQGRTQTVWIHAGLEHDPSTKVTRWQGQAVELTRREMSLLETFLMNPTKVWSKSQLQSKLYDWGDSEPESNALEVHIHHLRKKIHPNIVRNIRGVGYVLGSEGLLS